MGGQWRLRTSIRGFKNEVLRVSHFPNYSKLRTSTPPNLHFFKEAGSKVRDDDDKLIYLMTRRMITMTWTSHKGEEEQEKSSQEPPGL